MKKLGIIGCGVMGGAIVARVLIDDFLKEKDIIGFDVNRERVERFEICVASSLEELIEVSDVIVLAIKPQTYRGMNVSFGKKLVISIMAGVPLSDLPKKAIRVMPNLGVRNGFGAMSWVIGETVSKSDKHFFEGLMNCLGFGMEVKSDDEVDKMTALTGSGPAYLYAFLKALQEAGREFGFQDENLRDMLRTLVEGSLMAVGFEENFEDAISRVASKGGTTEAALDVLGDEWGDKLKEAVRAAYERSKEL